MALRRLTAALLALSAAAACGAPADPGSEAPAPSAGPVDDADAYLTVDRRATLALKQDLVTRFPAGSPPASVEAALAAEGYACGPDPTTPAERACLKETDRDGCVDHAVVRVDPYRPEVAQLIRACRIDAGAAAAPPVAPKP